MKFILVSLILLVVILLYICTRKSIEVFELKNGEKFYVFNPSIMAHNNEMISVYRLSNNSNSKRCKDVKYVHNEYIDDRLSKFSDITNFSTILYKSKDTYEVLDVFKDHHMSPNKQYIQGIEDPRLFRFRGDVWVYAHFRGLRNGEEIHCPIIFSLDNRDDIIFLTKDNMTKTEKNWMPFEYENELYLEYKTNPHEILKCDVETGKCVEVYSTETNAMTKDVGGGAPAQLVQWDGKTYFLGVSHTRNPYRNFFYIFNSSPPFNIIKVGKTLDIHGAEIEFVSGIVVQGDKITFSMGINDCYGETLSYRLKDLFITD